MTMRQTTTEHYTEYCKYEKQEKMSLLKINVISDGLAFHSVAILFPDLV